MSVKNSTSTKKKVPMRILYLVCLLLLSTNLFSQITIDLKNQPIKNILKEIEKSSSYKFFYNENLKGLEKTASLKVTNASIDVTMDKLLDNSGLSFQKQENDIILLIPKTTTKSAENSLRKVTGIVLDDKGEPIIGASVAIPGTTTGTTTDINGTFALDVANNATLTVSYLSYITQTVRVDNKTELNIVLREDNQRLDEVVVVGYGTQRKVNLTGAITSLKTEELNNIPTSNLSNSLAGRAAGVNVTSTSGMAGASSKIRMRGSFGEPLFVINNVIKEKADFDALDPNEVENISFLKDAASASIYGSKAGNGVVLVTTKGGKKQKPEFQYKGAISFSKTTRPLQDYSATDELIWANRVAATKGQPAVYGKEIFDYFADKSYNVNDYVWRDPSTREHNISVNGGNENIIYYMMLGVHDENGSYENLDFKKYNFRSDITTHISKRFKVNFNLSGNQREYDRFYWPYDEIDNFSVPDFYRTTFNWTRLYPFYVDNDGNPTSNTHANPVTTGALNPIEMVLGNRYQRMTKRTLDGQIRFDLDLGQFIDGLSTSFLGQYTAFDQNQKAFITHNKSYRFKSASPTNRFIPGKVDPNDLVIHNLSSTYEGIREYVQLSHSYQINWFLKYDKTFGKHAVSGLVVYEQAESGGKILNGQADGLLTSSIDQIFATSSDTQRRYFNGNEWEDARQSWVGRFNYMYADKYIAEFSFREDGNYKFAPKYRWGFFPSGSLAWRLTEEGFMQNLKWLSNLKLRGSYGSTGDDNNWNGDDNIVPFRWREYYQNGSGYYFGNSFSNGLAVGSTANPYISWAKLEVYNVGLDFAFLNNRLSGEFDVYYKNKNHILRARDRIVPGTYGANLSEENYAKQDWRGGEISMKWTDTYKDFYYNVYANVGYVKDRWRALDEPVGLEPWKSAINRPNTRIEGYYSEGIIRTQEQLDALPPGFTQFGRTPTLGVILFKDIRGANYSEGPDGKIDSNDLTYLSDNATPKVNFGFGFNLEWKGITLDAHFQGIGSYDRMLSTKNGGGVFQVGEKPYFELWTKDVWTPENINARYPAVSGQWEEEYGAAGSQFWMRDGGYVRLKNLNIGYRLPKKWYSRIGVNNIQLFVNGTNLFCISSMDEMDPEQDTLDSYPLMKTFTGGLSINF